MPRPLRNSSGPARAITLRLSPAAVERLDARRGPLSRGAYLEWMILEGAAPETFAPRGTMTVVPRSVTPPLVADPLPRPEPYVRTPREQVRQEVRKRVAEEAVAALAAGSIVGECVHKRYVAVTGGLLRCEDCGAVRGIDKRWRV